MIHILIKFLSFNFIEKIFLFEVYHYLGLKLIFIRPLNLLFNCLIAHFMIIFVFFHFVKYIFIIKDLICLFGSNLPILLIYHFLIIGSLIVNKVYYFFQINL